MKAWNIALWIFAALIALLMIFAGSTKLMSQPEMVQGFASMGHGVGFLHFIGLCEVLGGAGMLIPRVRFWAAAGLIPIMAGAVYTHISRSEMDHLPVPAIALVLLIISAYAHRGEAGRIFAKGNLLTGV